MTMYYRAHASVLRFSPSYIQTGVLSVVLTLLGTVCKACAAALSRFVGEGGVWASLFGEMQSSAEQVGAMLLAMAVIFMVLSAVLYGVLPDTIQIVIMVRRGLFHPSHGNPLHLREGELLPRIRCKCVGVGVYNLTICAQQGVSTEMIAQAVSSVSAALNHRFQRYAVVVAEVDVAYNFVTFRLEDVKADQSIIFRNVEDMRPLKPTLLKVNKGTFIDLTTSGSILVAGKTRSGKTTGVIALLLQVLSCGRDAYGSAVTIIDPKQAELSRLPHTVTLDKDGEARAILEALRGFAGTIACRQRVLNDLSEKQGDAVKWWDAGFHPSFLFIDEYVACRTLFPKKAAKDSNYHIDTFDSLLKRVVTMGASAGCFAIISIAEASVQDGGLPAMLRSAMSTRVLFRPTRTEGLLMWEKQKLDTLPERTYGPGDAWFSSTDGVHDIVSCVHFPILDFPVYRELGRLLQAY